MIRFPDLWHLDEASLVLVGPQSKVQSRKTNRDCKNTRWQILCSLTLYSVFTTLKISDFHTILEEDINSRGSITCDPLRWLYETEPAVDLPLQFNFGSPYRYLFSVTMYGQRTFCQLTFNSVFVQDNSPQLLLGCVLWFRNQVKWFARTSSQDSWSESKRIGTKLLIAIVTNIVRIMKVLLEDNNKFSTNSTSQRQSS